MSDSNINTLPRHLFEIWWRDSGRPEAHLSSWEDNQYKATYVNHAWAAFLEGIKTGRAETK